MKQLLLFGLLISFFQSITAQNSPPPPIPPPPPGLNGFELCDSNGDGSEIFDLSEIYLIEPQFSSNYYEPQYYESQEDADLNVNPINNPVAYSNISNPQIIYAKIIPRVTGYEIVQTTAILTTFYLLPSEQTLDHTVCSSDTLVGCFDLTDPYYYTCTYDYASGYNLSYHLTENDALLDSNPIDGPNQYFSESNFQNIYIRAENLLNESVEITSFYISSVSSPFIYSIEPTLTKADDDSDGIQTFDLTSHPLEVVSYDIGNYYISYHLTEDDLFNGYPEITNTTSFVNTTNPQTIYVRVTAYEFYGGCEFGWDYCYDSTSFELVVSDCLDYDNDGICNSQDSCPALDNSLIGTPCDDYDECTENEVWTEDCECVGTPVGTDSDNDGICDAEDICPGLNDDLIFTACDDGNDCTEYDYYTEDCECVGVLIDSDNDGVCDTEDICAGFDDSLIGTSCDDGNACTDNDVYTEDCGCEGTFTDSDNDGVCDTEDACPGFDDSLIGTSCDDDNACTDNDVYTEDCGCEGTFADSDKDGVCDAEDACPDFNDALIGTSCDDGDPCTTDDIYNDDCGCAGTFLDSDGDGVCDADDVCEGGDDTIDADGDGTPDACQPICEDRSDPFGNGTLTHSGQGSNSTEFDFPADSQNVTFTIAGFNQKTKGKQSNQYIEQISISYVGQNDTVQPYGTFSAANVSSVQVSISGIVKTISVMITDGQDGNSGSSVMDVSLGDLTYCTLTYPCLPDSDGDGICDAEDKCPDFNDNLIGTACDDGDSCTSNDTYQTDCGCVGSYTDADADGICVGDDPDDYNACIPNSDASNCNPCSDIIADDFENGFGNWNDGGNDASITNTNASSGTSSVRLRNDSGINSSIYTNSLVLSGFANVSLNFFYTTSGMRQGDGFVLEISQNGGNSFSQLKRLELQTDFNNGQQYFETVILGSPLSSSTVFRLRCEGSNKKSSVFIDNVVLTDCITENGVAKISKSVNNNLEFSKIKIFPNPATSELNISGLSELDSGVKFYNMLGQIVLQNKFSEKDATSHQVNLNGLSAGIYMVMITNAEDRINHQFKLVIKK